MADSTQFNPGSSNQDSARQNGGGKNNAGSNGSGMASDVVRTVGTHLISAVRDKTDSLLSEQKNRAADEIAAIGNMLQNSVQSADQSSRGALADYAETAAGEINRFADRLRTASWGELASDTEDFARRWPTLFIAGAVGLGFMAGRFLVASGDRSDHPAEAGAATANAGGPATGMSTGVQHQPTRPVGTGADMGAHAGYGSTGTGEGL